MTVKHADVDDYSLGGKIANLPAPSASGDAATKSYVDSAVNGLEWKAPVRAATSTNVNTATQGLGAIDGYTPSANDRILLMGQTTQSQNGIWLAQSGAWTRPNDFASGSVQQNAAVFVEGGTANASKTFVISGTGAVTVDTTAHTWVQQAQITPISGSGEVQVVGGVISLKTLNGKATGTITGDGATTSFVLAHTLNTTDVVIQVKDSSGNWVVVGTQATSTISVTITFATAPANAVTYRVVVIG